MLGNLTSLQGFNFKGRFLGPVHLLSTLFGELGFSIDLKVQLRAF
jgi:hypothetical protein